MKIIRSFSKTIQEKAYEPINIFCSAEAECGNGREETEILSRALDLFVREEVGKTLLQYRPQGASPQEKKERSLQEAELDTINYDKPPYKYPGSKKGWTPKEPQQGHDTPGTIDMVVGVGDELQSRGIDRK